MTITEGRRTELKKGLANWIDMGGHAYLVTFTNSHHRGDCLDGLLQGQKRLSKSFGKNQSRKMLKRLGYQGRIVATEVTWGEQNGWHPHYHMIFFDHQIDANGLQSYLALNGKMLAQKQG